MSQPIVVGYDPHTSDAAPIRFAVAAAELSQARVVVASVEAGAPVVPISGAQTVAYATALPDAGLVDDCGPALDQLAADLAARRIAVECRRVRSTSAARGLHQAAIEEDAGLLVVGSTRRGPLGRVLSGSTAHRLLHGAPCPVAVAPAGWAESRLRTVGVAYGGGDEGCQVLRAAHALARRTGARLMLVAVVSVRLGVLGDTEAPLAGQLGKDETELASKRKQRLERELRDLVGAMDGDVEVTIDVRVGEPAETLVDLSERLDLLVCGARSYGPMRAVLLGGVSLRLVDEARCPVIVLPRGAHGWLEELASEAPAMAVGT